MSTYGSGTYGSGTYGSDGLGPVVITSASTVSASLSGTVTLGTVAMASASTVAVNLSSDAAASADDTQPTLLVELGLTAGSGLFTLDDATLSQLNANKLGDELGFVWTDVTSYVLDPNKVALSRGSTRAAGPYYRTQAGRLSFRLKNLDGRFDPDNLDGPYVAAGVSALKPDVWVRVRATFNDLSVNLWTGRITSWEPTYPEAGAVAFVDVDAQDAPGILSAGDPIPSTAPAGDTPPTRIGRILDAVGWPDQKRDIGTDADWVTLPSQEIEGTAWSQLSKIADSAVGYLFSDREGRVVYRSHAGFPRSVQVSFGPTSDTTKIRFRDPLIRRDPDQVFDTVKLTREGGNEQSLEDLDARAANGGVMRTHTDSGLLIETGSQVTKVASFILSQYRNISTHVERFDVRLTDASPSWQWTTMLRLDLLDHVDITYATPDGRTVTLAGLVRGLALTKAHNEWTWTVSLVRAPEPGGEFTLDDAALGVLDANTLAAF